MINVQSFIGKDHAFMPIAIATVSQEKFNTWLKLAKNNLDSAFNAIRMENKSNKLTEKIEDSILKLILNIYNSITFIVKKDI